MIVGIGIDLVFIPDFARNLENLAFIKKVFTESESLYCQSHASPTEHFAGKFAAKEALMKAIKKGIRQEIWFSQIEVLNHSSGAPYFSFHRKAQDIIEALHIHNIHLSISHSNNNAVAIVIIESLEK